MWANCTYETREKKILVAFGTKHTHQSDGHSLDNEIILGPISTSVHVFARRHCSKHGMK